jgi:hypothetical protein
MSEVSNKKRGEVTLAIGERSFLFKLGIKEMAILEDMLNKKILKLIDAMEQGEFGVSDLRQVLLVCGTGRNGSRFGMDVVDSIIEDYGLNESFIFMGQLFEAAFPASDPNEDPKDPPET